MFEFTRESFPQLAQGDEGRFAAFIFGPYKKYTPVGIQVGTTDALGEDITASDPPTGGALVCSTPETFERFGASGTVQIDNERITYTSKSASTLELRGITRGASGTTAADHESGTTIYEVLPTFKYSVCENPRIVHFTRSVDNIYLDGRRVKSTDKPTITINLDDQSVSPGRSFVTLSVDITSFASVPTPPATPPPTRQPSVGIGSRPGRPPIYYGGASGGGSGGSSGGYYQAPSGGAPKTGTAVNPPVGVTPTTTPTIERGVPLPLVGHLEVDVTGLQDDSVGTLTTTPNRLLEFPAEIVLCLLREAWGQRDDTQYDFTSFAETHALQVAESANFKWRLAYEGLSFNQWREMVFLASKAHVHQQNGKWKYTYRRREAPVYTFQPDELITPSEDGCGWTLGLTPRTELLTELPVRYDRSLTERRFLLRDDAAIAKYGIQRNKELRLEWIYDTDVAKRLGYHWLGQWNRQRVNIRVRSPWRAVALEQWDQVRFNIPILSAWGVSQVTFHVIDQEYNADESLWTYVCEEGDAPGLTLSGRWRTVVSRSALLSGKWSLGSPPVAGGSQALRELPGIQPMQYSGTYQIVA